MADVSYSGFGWVGANGGCSYAIWLKKVHDTHLTALYKWSFAFKNYNATYALISALIALATMSLILVPVAWANRASSLCNSGSMRVLNLPEYCF